VEPKWRCRNGFSKDDPRKPTLRIRNLHPQWFASLRSSLDILRTFSYTTYKYYGGPVGILLLTEAGRNHPDGE